MSIYLKGQLIHPLARNVHLFNSNFWIRFKIVCRYQALNLFIAVND